MPNYTFIMNTGNDYKHVPVSFKLDTLDMEFNYAHLDTAADKYGLFIPCNLIKRRLSQQGKVDYNEVSKLETYDFLTYLRDKKIITQSETVEQIYMPGSVLPLPSDVPTLIGNIVLNNQVQYPFNTKIVLLEHGTRPLVGEDILRKLRICFNAPNSCLCAYYPDKIPKQAQKEYIKEGIHRCIGCFELH